MKRFVLAVSAALFLIGMALLFTGCSTYGHEQGKEPDLIGEPPMRAGSDPILGGDCAPGTCCVLGSCGPYGCPDNWTCQSGICREVAKVCGGAK